MRLINVQTIQLEDYFSREIPRYAILSHTWGEEEVTFDEFNTAQARQKEGFRKIRGTCERAAFEGYQYVWVDTCCIDKRSSAELTEAINSMCAWYENAGVCYAYLADVEGTSADANFFSSRWWTRGWTLQELLAPKTVVFLNKNWVHVGTKESLCSEISENTGIDDISLIELGLARLRSIAERMSWASTRSTTRIEDRAYSLLGIFDVNLPLLYGEGQKAFTRLQEEILRTSEDQSIFAWGLAKDMKSSFEQLKVGPSHSYFAPKGYTFCKPLASSPDLFKYSREVSTLYVVPEQTPFGLTNLGIQIRLLIVPTSINHSEDAMTYIGVLTCHEEFGSIIGIPLLRMKPPSQQYVRLCTTENDSKSTFVFDAKHLLNASSQNIILSTLPSKPSEGAQLQQNYMFIRSLQLALSIGPNLGSLLWGVTNIEFDDSGDRTDKRTNTFRLDQNYTVITMANDGDYYKRASLVLRSIRAEDLCTIFVELDKYHLEKSFCRFHVPEIASHLLSSGEVKVLMDNSKSLILRSRNVVGSTTKTNIVRLNVSLSLKSFLGRFDFLVLTMVRAPEINE